MKPQDTYVYKLRDKLLKYIEVHGVVSAVLARYIGVSIGHFHHIKKGRVRLCIQKWEQIAEFSRGYISEEDLVEYQLELIFEQLESLSKECNAYNFKYKHDETARKITIKY